MSLKSWDSQ